MTMRTRHPSSMLIIIYINITKTNFFLFSTMLPPLFSSSSSSTTKHICNALLRENKELSTTMPRLVSLSLTFFYFSQISKVFFRHGMTSSFCLAFEETCLNWLSKILHLVHHLSAIRSDWRAWKGTLSKYFLFKREKSSLCTLFFKELNNSFPAGFIVLFCCCFDKYFIAIVLFSRLLLVGSTDSEEETYTFSGIPRLTYLFLFCIFHGDVPVRFLQLHKTMSIQGKLCL